jgi:hypothetical protein
MEKFVFSGHDSFQCKTQWLKKGYDFVTEQYNFNVSEAVITLGVGKNMVAAIRHWLRAFDILDTDQKISEIGHYIFNAEFGVDPFTEDLSTLWLLHYHLIKRNYASIYRIAFVDFHREKIEFTREQLQLYIKRRCKEEGWDYLYNENTAKKDVGVFIQNYVVPDNSIFDDFSVLLLQLDLIKKIDKTTYTFNYINKQPIDPHIFLYAISDYFKSNSIGFDALMELGLIFCMTNLEVIETLEQVCTLYPNEVVFSDVAGIKEFQFKERMDWRMVLNSYYRR